MTSLCCSATTPSTPNSAYTGLTRGRAVNRLCTVVPTRTPGENGMHDLSHVIAALGVSRAKTAALDGPDTPAIA